MISLRTLRWGRTPAVATLDPVTLASPALSWGVARDIPAAALTDRGGWPPLDHPYEDDLGARVKTAGTPPLCIGVHPMYWLLLFLAGLLEVGWAIGLKYTEGFTRPIATFLTVASMIASMVLLGLAVRSLPLGTAYAVWTGIGTVGTALLGIWLFQEPATAARLACIGLILAGIVGLKLVTTA